MYSFFDSGTSDILIAKGYFIPIITQLLAAAGNPQYLIQNGVVFTECNAKWKPLNFLIKGYWIELLPEHYIIDVSKNNDSQACALKILPNKQAFFIFGIPIL